jgi:hypothetical protein
MLADNGGERSRNRAAPTVKEMGEALIARMRRDDLKKSHIETASGHLRKHINPLLGDMLVSQVVEGDTERLVTRLTNAGLAPKTIHNYIGTFHSSARSDRPAPVFADASYVARLSHKPSRVSTF